MVKKYKVDFDPYVILVTLTVALLVPFLVFTNLLQEGRGTQFYVLMTCLIFSVAVLVYFFIRMPLFVQITDSGVRIVSFYKKYFFSYGAIHQIAKVRYTSTTLTSGSYGVFGYIGSAMDQTRFLVTNRKKMLSIKTDDGTFVFSVANNTDLYNDITERIGK